MGHWNIRDIDKRMKRDTAIREYIKSLTTDEQGTALYILMRAIDPRAVNEAFKLLKDELYCDEKNITRSVMQKWW